MILRKIFIDTNILINACTADYSGKEVCRKCLNYIFKLRDAQLFTSANAIIVMFSKLQNKSGNRPPIPKQSIIEYYNKLLSKITILECTEKDIDDSILLQHKDMEDNFQYTVGKKVNCNYYITEDVKAFNKFKGIVVVNPKKYSML
jgi:predicted nucleic acid-binding protein